MVADRALGLDGVGGVGDGPDGDVRVEGASFPLWTKLAMVGPSNSRTSGREAGSVAVTVFV